MKLHDDTFHFKRGGFSMHPILAKTPQTSLMILLAKFVMCVACSSITAAVFLKIESDLIESDLIAAAMALSGAAIGWSALMLMEYQNP